MLHTARAAVRWLTAIAGFALLIAEPVMTRAAHRGDDRGERP